MPRTGQGPGGVRNGKQGGQYPNRSDLRSPGQDLVAKNQPYGERQRQQAAQRAVPITAPPDAGAGGPGAPAPPPAPGVPPGGAPGGDVPPGMAPGELKFLHPTERPNEPITAGLPIGPGPGPEAMTGIGKIAQNMAPTDSATALLAHLASQPTAGATLRGLAGLSTAGTVRG
jgi:hypothetical protein